MKLRRSNEYMFQIVECNTYMKRIKDGKYIRHSEQYSDVYYYVDENAEEKERKVEPEEWGGSDFVKTYYEAVEKRFVGVVIGMKLIKSFMNQRLNRMKNLTMRNWILNLNRI